MNQPEQTIKRATIGIALLVLLSKGVGFLREMIIAYRFGTGIEYDIYLISVSVPIALYSLFGYSFSNMFIPRYSYALSGKNKKSGLSDLWSDFNLSLLAALAAVIGIVVMAPYLIRLIAPGLDNRYLPEAVLLVRVSSVIVILAVFEAFFRSILNAEKHFFIPAAGPVLANTVLIASILFFSEAISTKAILYGLVIGYLAQTLLVFIPFRKTRILDFFHARFFRKHSGKFVTTAGIILVIEGASQVYAIVDRYFASSMDPGIVSALGYAYLLVMLPVAIFAYALSTAIFPYMTDAFAEKDRERSSYLLTRGITVCLLMALPMMMIFWVFSEKMVLLLFKRGAFDSQSVAYTSSLLKYLALGMAGQFLLWLMSRAYYAVSKYSVLITYVIIALLAKIIVAILAVDAWGYIGLAVSSSISYLAGAAWLVIFAGRMLARVDAKGILQYVIKVLVATAFGYLTARLLYGYIIDGWNSFGLLLIGLPAAIALTLLVVFAVGYILNISDIRNLVDTVRRKNTVDDKN